MSPQLDPNRTGTLTRLHMRLIDRIHGDKDKHNGKDKEPPQYRCLECGAIIEDPMPGARPSS